jgi:cytochrome c553
MARGKAIFDRGDPSRGIVACSNCHGADGKGSGPIPRLAGQHADYVLKQLLVIQNALRSVPAMHGIVQSLKPDEMKAVATYVESLE